VRLQKRRVFASGVLGLGAALVLAGCGAGQITQTDTMLPAVNGALAQAGKLSLRNIGIANRNDCEQAYTAGSGAPLTLTIANEGGQDDELVSVSSENAASATIQGQKTVVARSTLVVGPADQAESASSSSASPTTGQNSSLGHASIVLQGLKSVIWPGQLTPVTFVFRDAGPVTAQLPVAAPTKALDNCESAVQQAEGGGH
jgi:copper(I)-binding protein